MPRGQLVKIPILGINNELLDDQSIDGLCDSIVNCKPKGSVEQPYWAPFEKINSLKNSSGTNFTYEFGLASITDAFWQVRNQIGEFAEDLNGSLKRLLVLCQNPSRKCIDIIEPSTWTIIKTLPLPVNGAYTWSCTRSDQVTVISINKDQKPYLMYYLIDDAFIPAGWPDMPEIAFSTVTETLLQADVDAGNTKAIMREDTPQYIWVTWAFRLFDGTHIKHNQPTLVTIQSGSELEAVKPVFTLNGYGVNNPLNDQPFWKELIRGISVCATIPRNDKQETIDDGSYFILGYFPFIDKLPADQWPTAEDPNIITVVTKSDNWPTLKDLGIDNFTHHNIATRVLDTYNKRILLGGSSVDFILPEIASNTSQNTVPGGVYSQYMNFDSGSANYDYRYYFANGQQTDFNSEWDYEVDSTDHISVLTPMTGREFKAVSIVESVNGNQAETLPHGEALPATSYTANLTNQPGKLYMQIVATQSDFSPASSLPESVAKMRLKLEIGPVGSPTDEVIYFWVQPGGNQAPFLQFSDIELENDSIVVGARVYHRITIKTESGTYYRILRGDLADGTASVTLPEFIWYPDRRATRYELIVENNGIFELGLDKQLNQHPESNYSYIYLSVSEQSYVLGSHTATTTAPDMLRNQELQYIPNRIQASISGNAFILDPIATYRVGNRENDTILGFAINLNPTSEGQAGQYPVYALSDKGIWALEQTGDPSIAFGRISPVSNFNGINNPYAYCNAQELIVATDNKYIYALAGLEVTRIDKQIANDPDYADYLKQIRIGYHRAADYEELIFSNPFYDYSLCYNIKYKVWYKATERFKFFFYDYPELMGMTVDNALKDFSSKDPNAAVAWEITTRVIQYGDPYVFKRLYPFFIRMRVDQPLQEEADNYNPMRIQLKGYRDTPTMEYLLFDQTIKSDTVFDPRVYHQFGSMYAYRLILSGNHMHKNSNIKWLDTDVEVRYQRTRRRHNCSAQYLYAMQNSAISICNCSDGGGGTDAYFSYTGTAEESRVVTHGLGKIPSVFVTDENGYLIEVGVQLIIVNGQPDLNRTRLTFDDPVNYKAYFN
ncbi:MAG: hypothetical protein CL555_01400 [Algoriphagus sp.]|nr:hypothetical protein [Algoriphagus sp.]